MMSVPGEAADNVAEVNAASVSVNNKFFIGVFSDVCKGVGKYGEDQLRIRIFLTLPPDLRI